MNNAQTRIHPLRTRASGLGLVELMLALSLGLALIATLAPAWLHHANLQRHLLMQLRLTQDQRHAQSLMTRELRQSGYWTEAHQALWPQGAGPGQTNPYSGVWVATNARSLTYAHAIGTENQHCGFRMHPTARTLDLRLSANQLEPGDADQWQALTDPAQVRLEQFEAGVQSLSASLLDACLHPTCPTGADDCPPRWIGTRVNVTTRFAAVKDSTLQREGALSVATRNGQVAGRCPN